jgi:hypothetical protein
VTELTKIKLVAGGIVLFLAVAILGSLGAIFWSLYVYPRLGLQNVPQDLLICLAAATLGSALSSLVSAGNRIANGWELADGTKKPEGGTADKFTARMTALFVMRPLLGGILGAILYVGLRSGYVIPVENASEIRFTKEGLTFLSFLVGLSAKTFIDRLRSMFDSLFGKK